MTGKGGVGNGNSICRCVYATYLHSFGKHGVVVPNRLGICQHVLVRPSFSLGQGLVDPAVAWRDFAAYQERRSVTFRP